MQKLNESELQEKVIELLKGKELKFMDIIHGLEEMKIDVPPATTFRRILTVIVDSKKVQFRVERPTNAKIYTVKEEHPKDEKPKKAEKPKKESKAAVKSEASESDEPLKRKKHGRSIDPQTATHIRKGDLIEWKIIRGEGKGQIARGIVKSTHEWLRQLSFDTVHPITKKWARVNIKNATLVSASGEFNESDVEWIVYNSQNA